MVGAIVLRKVQEKLPYETKNAVPNAVHGTSKSKSKSHATGESVVPESTQEAAPESVLGGSAGEYSSYGGEEVNK